MSKAEKVKLRETAEAVERIETTQKRVNEKLKEIRLD